MAISRQQMMIGGGIAAAMLAAYVLTRKGVAQGTGQAIGGAAVDLVGGVLRGVNDALPEAVRPTSDQNIFFRASNLPGQIVTGDPSWSIGGWVYDITH